MPENAPEQSQMKTYFILFLIFPIHIQLVLENHTAKTSEK